jgi:hypothetical protein
MNVISLGASALAAFLLSLPVQAQDDERCTQGKSLRLVNGKIHTRDSRDQVVSRS